MKSFTLVIFGISSNLAQIKLIPALYDLEEKGLLPTKSRIMGIARTPQANNWIKDYVTQVLKQENKHHKHSTKQKVVKRLMDRFYYLSGDVNDPNLYHKIKASINSDNVIFYLATYPDLYHQIFEGLKDSKVNSSSKGWVRLIVEKPIGTNFNSSKKLNRLLSTYFKEDQIYRLDHYLGKETLQNILTFRFAGSIIEPLMNKDHIDHIQISALEDFGIGQRGGYYDKVGALKDVGQNHLLQMLAIACMDAPSDFSNEAITYQRIKILKSLVAYPKKIVFGQYRGFLKEANVTQDSNTDTFFALKAEISSDRFKGVPIYMRAGKRLSQTVTEISIIFKTPTNRLFKHLAWGNQPNILIYRIQPNEGIVLKILTKKPGHNYLLQSEFMQFCYRQNLAHYLPDAYERLLLDAIKGDQTFFNDAAEVEAQWQFIDSLTKEIQLRPFIYRPGSWGPKEADKLIKADGKAWLEPSMQFCNI